MDYADLFDWIADQIALAVPSNVLYWAQRSYLPDMPPKLWRMHSAFRKLPQESQEQAVDKWFTSIEPGEMEFIPWEGPYPTDGF